MFGALNFQRIQILLIFHIKRGQLHTTTAVGYEKKKTKPFYQIKKIQATYSIFQYYYILLSEKNKIYCNVGLCNKLIFLIKIVSLSKLILLNLFKIVKS